jgi:rSAM/selenodomain-associated transferase 1
MKENAFILFLRYPEKGRIKTRLARDIGDDLAYDLYVCFLKDIIETVRLIDADMLIAGSGTAREGSDYLFGVAPRISQHGRDLGSRMYNALADVFSMGYSRISLAGGDIPGLEADTIREAFRKLLTHDLVLGPSLDGGYYLIACCSGTLRRSLFAGIPWSTSLVLAETLRRIEDSGMSTFLLPPMDDIDDLDALKRFRVKQRRQGVDSNTLRCVEKNKEMIYGPIRL